MKNRLFYCLTFLFLICLGIRGNNTENIDFRISGPLKASGINTGKIEALVILIEFADRKAYFSQMEVDSFFNQVGYAKYHDNGSIHDYWAAVSQNRVNVHTIVTAYYKAPKTFAYYDTEGGGHTHELLDSALNWVEARGFDFSKLTVDENKNIKALSFQFVGNSGASGLWGHSSGHYRTFDGVNTSSYQISELGTSEMHLGGICHEQGHMLFGFPDTYDTDGSNGGSSGCGKFDLMAAGNSDNSGAPSGNPMPPNPYFRYLAGWNDMISLNDFPNDSTLKIIANSWNTYVYRNPDRNGEMYIVEARKKPFRNVDMPGEGVLVWHIDSLISGNTNQQRTEQLHYKVSVVQADGQYHLESGSNIGDSNDYFKSGVSSNLTIFYTKWWNAAYSGLQLRNIGAVSDTMVVTYGSNNASDVRIKSSRTNGGNVSPFGVRYFTQNSTQVYATLPMTGFEVEDCIVDGVSQGPLAKYTFSGITEPHEIKFLFTHKAVALKDVRNVVNYSYYEGVWSSVPDFSKLVAVKSGEIVMLSLSIPGRINDNFGIHFSGYIKAPVDGEYTFYLTSDDGSRFLIDGSEIVANQCNPETSGKMRLRAGYHPFTFDFFEGQVTESFSLKWSGPGFAKTSVRGLVVGTVDLSASVDVQKKDAQAEMYTDSQNFTFNCPGESTIDVEVYSLSGMLLGKQTLSTSNDLASMPNSSFKSGLYCIKVNAGNRTILRQKVSIIR